MTFIIVYKDGSIKRFISVDYCDTGNSHTYNEYDSIILHCNDYQSRYEIKKEDIASVVFYP